MLVFLGMDSKKRRSTVIELLKNGKTSPQIVSATGFTKNFVNRVIKRYKELGNDEDRPRSGRPATAVTPQNINKIRCRIRRNNVRSMRKMANALKIDEKSVRTIVHKKLGVASYRINKAHLLNDRMKANRKAKAKKMLRLVAAGRLKRVLFTDEKIFTVQPVHNRQNLRQLLKRGLKNTFAAKLMTRQHFPKSVMVWAGVCATGKTPLVFIDRNVKINAGVYQQTVLKDVVQPWASNHFGQAGFTLQQDWAPAHGAQSTIDLCTRLFPGFWDKTVWPSNSPDLNPLDFSIWSILEQKISGKRYDTVEALKRVLKRAWDEITVAELATIVESFRKRLKKCIEADGGNFEHLL